MGGGIAPTSQTRTVVVLGAAYGGARAAQIIAAGLPEDWKLILIDRNSHANHVYVMPRYAVLSGHEYKSFIPYTNVFLTPEKNPNHIVLKTHVLSLRPSHVTLSQSFPEHGFPTATIAFDYAIYALGAHQPAPLDLWGTDPRSSFSGIKEEIIGDWTYNGFKAEGIEWFNERQKVIEKAPTVLVVGGGALGIQFATDIKAVYPEKKVTLLHSRKQLLPRFDEAMHNEIRNTLETQEIDLILGERLDLSTVGTSIRSGKENSAEGQRIVRTVAGREIVADLLLLCIGQVPNSALLAAMDPSTVNTDTKLARVEKTMQLANSPSPALPSESTLAGEVEEKVEEQVLAAYPNIFVIGDVADAFGAIAAGHTAYAQGEVAGRNIIRLIKRLESGKDEEALEEYTPGAPAIKVSLGLTKSVYQVGPHIGTKDDGQPDLQAAAIWPYYGIKVEKDEDMLP